MAKAKTSRQNRTPKLRRLAALAAIGLISLSGSSPALAERIGSNDNVTSAATDDGLTIVAGDGSDTTATWYRSTTSTIAAATPGGLVLSDDGNMTTAGRSDLILRGAGTFEIAKGDIFNDNHASNSTITIITKNGQLLLTEGDIIGNNKTTLIIESQGSSNDSYNLKAENADVMGKVTFKDISTAPNTTPLDSKFWVGSIGENGAATVKTDGVDTVHLKVSGNVGNKGGSNLTLGGTAGTVMTIGGNLGGVEANSDENRNFIDMGNNPATSLAVSGAAMGYLDIKTNNATGALKIDTLGGSTVESDIFLDGNLTISNQLVGKISIESKNNARRDHIYMADGPDTKDIGSSGQSGKLDLTLKGADYDPTGPVTNETLNDLALHTRNINGGTTADASTTIHIDTTNAAILSDNIGNKADVSGHVKIDMIGDSATNMRFGELTQGSTFTFSKDETAAQKGATVIFNKVNATDSSDPSTDTVNIINTTEKAVVINSLYSGILNVGSGGASTETVRVEAVVGGADLAIASVKNPDGSYDRGQVTLDAQKIAHADSGNPDDFTTINLGNATLKIADDTVDDIDDHNDMGWAAGSFSMDSTNGESRLIGDQGSNIPGNNTMVFSNAATVTVGSGTKSGNVVIETNSLEYDDVLKSSDVAGTQGAVYFKDSATNKNKMIFRSSNNTNNFTKGVQIAAGNWEFQGSTTFTDATATQNKMTGSDIYFTGNELVDADADYVDANYVDDAYETNATDLANASTFTVDVAGDDAFIDATDSKLYLNKNVQLKYDNGGLGQFKEVVLGGDNEETLLSFAGTNTLLSAKNITIGQALTDFSDPRGGQAAAVKGDLWVGGQAPTGTKGLTGDSITLHNRLTVDGALTINNAPDGTAPSIIIGAEEAGFTLTKNSDGSSIGDADTKVKVEFDTELFTALGEKRFAAIDILEGTASQDEMIARMADGLKISNLEELRKVGFNGTDKVYADGLVLFGADGVGGHNVPKFAQSMVNAIGVGADQFTKFDSLHGYIVDRGGAGTEEQFQRELTQIMGNTMNSSLSLVQNGTTQAFSRLNASAPTIAGYRTAQAVAAPRRAPVQAPAPSTNIGVPIRATDPIAVQPQPAAVPPAPVAPASGSDDGRPNGFWITPNYIQMSMDGNYREGYGDYDVKSMGMIMGYDKWVNENARLGAFLSYSSPKLENDFQEIKADDIQVGVYAQGVTPSGIILNAALAMGRQNYSSKRDIKLDLPDWDQNIKADYNGKSVSAALEASRPVTFENDMYMRPAIGYSIQNISLDDIREETNNKAYNLAQKVSSGSFNIQQARLGTDIGWVNPDNTVTVTGKAFLVANLGDTQPEGRASFITADSQTFNVYGAEMDDTMANLGLGLKFTPADQEGLIISLDYDAMLGSNTQSHNLGLMIRYEF